MAEQFAIMHEAGSIPGIPGTFPGGCMVKYDYYTREVLEVKPLGYVEVVETEETPAPVETPQEAPAPTPVDVQSAPAQTEPTQNVEEVNP